MNEYDVYVLFLYAVIFVYINPKLHFLFLQEARS